MNIDRTSWRRLVAGPSAISIWSVLGPLPLLIAIRFLDPVVAASDDQRPYLLATMAGLVVVGGGAWLAWLTVLRPHRRSPRVIMTLTVFAALGAARVATIASVESMLGVPPSRTMPHELMVGAVQGLVVLVTVSVVVNSRREYVQITQRLRATRARIQAVEATDRTTAERVGRALLDEFTDEVARRLESMATESDAGPASVSARVRSLSAEVVRPMSHTIAQEWNTLLPSAVVATPTASTAHAERSGRAARSVREFASTLQPPQPLLVALLMASLAAPALTRMIGAAFTAVILLPSAAILILGTLGVGRLMRRWQGKPIRLLAILLIGPAATAAVTSVVNRRVLLALTGIDHSFAEPIFVFTFLCASVSIIATATHLAARRRAALVEGVEQEAAAGEELAQSVSALRRAASQYLHSQVQAELMATSLLLQRAPSDQAAVAAILHDAAQRVKGGLAAAASSTPVDDLRAKLEFWSAVSGVTPVVDGAAWQRLATHPDVASRVSQLLTEALTNAVKHGAAGQIEVNLTATGSDAIEVTVRNPGQMRRLGDGMDVGLGLSAMRELSDDFALAGEQGEVHLRAVVTDRVTA